MHTETDSIAESMKVAVTVARAKRSPTEHLYLVLEISERQDFNRESSPPYRRKYAVTEVYAGRLRKRERAWTVVKGINAESPAGGLVTLVCNTTVERPHVYVTYGIPFDGALPFERFVDLADVVD